MPLRRVMPEISRSTELPVLPEEYKVEKVLGHQWNNALGHRKGQPLGRMEYYVKWSNYPNSESTWEPYKHFASDDCSIICDKLLEYLQLIPIDV